mgnify:FL=1
MPSALRFKTLGDYVQKYREQAKPRSEHRRAKQRGYALASYHRIRLARSAVVTVTPDGRVRLVPVAAFAEHLPHVPDTVRRMRQSAPKHPAGQRRGGQQAASRSVAALARQLQDLDRWVSGLARAGNARRSARPAPAQEPADA